MTIILVAKDKILVIMDTCDYKPCSPLGQVAKDNQLQKMSHSMCSDTDSCISLATAWTFHPLVSHRTMQLHTRLHKILGNILKIIKSK